MTISCRRVRAASLNRSMDIFVRGMLLPGGRGLRKPKDNAANRRRLRRRVEAVGKNVTQSKKGMKSSARALARSRIHLREGGSGRLPETRQSSKEGATIA